MFGGWEMPVVIGVAARCLGGGANVTVGAAARECWRKRADSSLSGQDEGRERPGNASVELWRPSRMGAGTWGTQLCHPLPL